MHIRPYTEADLSAVAQLFTDAIHGLAVSHYDEVQRAAWAPRPPDLSLWENRLKPIKVLVAQEETQEENRGALLGFIGYENNGHIDLMFTSPAAARRGIASRLLGQAEAVLRALEVKELFTEASLLGRPFFERQGFAVKEEQHIELRGAHFRRFAMVKALGHGKA
ncbi:putative acetyltransferase [Polaromonas sp. YR568]|uniref:GNAT family N-acetyltransferase n=1 Tax=Polaromonas sp. YR568 TaxID=1855301 RepID=UPI0008E8582D|nr:GNAT family N-acetyltransferase [Polaromonas sp. YR568]SFU94878.1 putative acetyltransferase [Polaromonas sp. YR568]